MTWDFFDRSALKLLKAKEIFKSLPRPPLLSSTASTSELNERYELLILNCGKLNVLLSAFEGSTKTGSTIGAEALQEFQEQLDHLFNANMKELSHVSMEISTRQMSED